MPTKDIQANYPNSKQQLILQTTQLPYELIKRGWDGSLTFSRLFLL